MWGPILKRLSPTCDRTQVITSDAMPNFDDDNADATASLNKSSFVWPWRTTATDHTSCSNILFFLVVDIHTSSLPPSRGAAKSDSKLNPIPNHPLDLPNAVWLSWSAFRKHLGLCWRIYVVQVIRIVSCVLLAKSVTWVFKTAIATSGTPSQGLLSQIVNICFLRADQLVLLFILQVVHRNLLCHLLHTTRKHCERLWKSLKWDATDKTYCIGVRCNHTCGCILVFNHAVTVLWCVKGTKKEHLVS